MVSDWLKRGWQLWSSDALSFGRDFFLPLPNHDWSSVRQVMAEYADIVGLSKQVLRSLRVPVRQGSSWQLSEKPLFTVEASLSFWKEHSERHWLNSHLAAIGVSKDRRDFVGRWHISSSDEYLRTECDCLPSRKSGQLLLWQRSAGPPQCWIGRAGNFSAFQESS